MECKKFATIVSGRKNVAQLYFKGIQIFVFMYDAASEIIVYALDYKSLSSKSQLNKFIQLIVLPDKIVIHISLKIKHLNICLWNFSVRNTVMVMYLKYI